MSFRAEMTAPIAEADITKLMTADLAKMLADHANSRAAEVDSKNKEIIASQPLSLQALIPVSARFMPPSSTINGAIMAVNDNNVRAALSQKTITIEYAWKYLQEFLTEQALLAAGEFLLTRYIRHEIVSGVVGLLEGGNKPDEQRATVLSYISSQLEEHSPVLTGTYQSSHRLTADGSEITPGEATADMQEFVFINTTPYARKIEIGYSKQTPDGVYEAVASMAANEFGDIADISFDWRDPPPDAETRMNRTPAITVTFK